MFKAVVLLLLPWAIFAQQLVYQFKFDTTKYESSYITTYVVPYPNIPSTYFGSSSSVYMSNTYLYCQALKLKNSSQYDIYALEGKVGTVTINVPNGAEAISAIISQTILDNDDGWEYILNYLDTLSGLDMFSVVDDNNAVLLSDSGFANYGFDGQNTYVVSFLVNGLPNKVWKFRSNIASISPGLAKTSASAAPIMALMPSGNFRINLAPSANGQTSIQLFDMLGRLVFAKNIQDMKTQTSYVIPSNNIPKSPFMTKVNNGNGVFYQKEIPAR